MLLNLHAHLNCVFAHLTLFNARFRLIDSKETEILHDLVVALKLQPEDDVSNTETSSNSGGTGNSGSTGSATAVVPGAMQQPASTSEGCDTSNSTAISTSSPSSGSTSVPTGASSIQRRSSRCEDSYLQCEVPLLNEPLLGRQETVAGVSH